MIWLYIKKYWYYIPIILLAIVGTAIFIMSGGQVKVVFDLMNKFLQKKDQTAVQIELAGKELADSKAQIIEKREADLKAIEEKNKKEFDDAKKDDKLDDLADNLWGKKNG